MYVKYCKIIINKNLCYAEPDLYVSWGKILRHYVKKQSNKAIIFGKNDF